MARGAADSRRRRRRGEDGGGRPASVLVRRGRGARAVMELVMMIIVALCHFKKNIN